MQNPPEQQTATQHSFIKLVAKHQLKPLESASSLCHNIVIHVHVWRLYRSYIKLIICDVHVHVHDT